MGLIARIRAAGDAFLASGKKPEPTTDLIGAAASSYFPQFVDSRWALQTVDDLVLQKGCSVYREMNDRDDQVQSCLGFLTYARLSTGGKIVPASDDPADLRVADFVQYVLDELKGSSTTRFFMDLMEAPWMGFACVEKAWGDPIVGGDFAGLRPYRTFRALAQETVTVKVDLHGDIEPDGVWQSKPGQMVAPGIDPSQFEHFPREKFVLWCWKMRWSNPLGMSILRSAYPYYFFKRETFKRWARYLEKHGLPRVVVEAPEKATQSQLEDAAEIARRFQSDLCIAVKKGVTLNVTEPSSAPTVNFTEAITAANRGIAHACFMPTNLIDQTDTGSFAKARVDQAAFVWVLKNLGLLLSDDAMNEQVIAPLCEMNFGESVKPPRWEFNPFEQKDLESMARVRKTLSEVGFPLSKAEIAATFDVDPADTPEDELKAAQPATPQPGMPIPGLPTMEQMRAVMDEEGAALEAMVAEIIRARTSSDPEHEVADVLRGNGRTKDAAKVLVR